jgi:hypothetical protein
MHVEFEGFNLANRRDSAIDYYIDYYYPSRLANEPVGSPPRTFISTRLSRGLSG